MVADASKAADVAGVVRDLIAGMTDDKLRAATQECLVPVYPVERDWDYGDERYTCWVVLEHPTANVCIAYCEHGFGPRLPWGLLAISGNQSMGMDSEWFETLEEAVISAGLDDPS